MSRKSESPLPPPDWDYAGPALMEAYAVKKFTQADLRRMFKDYTGRKLWRLLVAGTPINNATMRRRKQ